MVPSGAPDPVNDGESVGSPRGIDRAVHHDTWWGPGAILASRTDEGRGSDPLINCGARQGRSMTVGDVRQFEWIAPLYDVLTPAIDASSIERGLALAERPVERVIDVGGGTGRAARAVSAPRRIVVDPARGMTARALAHDLEAVRADGATLPLGDASVDAVLIVDALHHVADRRGALTESHRVLRPGGVLVVVEFDPTTVRGRLLVAGEHLVGLDSTFQPPESLREAMARIGFDTRITDGGFAYTVVGTSGE